MFSFWKKKEETHSIPLWQPNTPVVEPNTRVNLISKVLESMPLDIREIVNDFSKNGVDKTESYELSICFEKRGIYLSISKWDITLSFEDVIIYSHVDTDLDLSMFATYIQPKTIKEIWLEGEIDRELEKRRATEKALLVLKKEEKIGL